MAWGDKSKKKAEKKKRREETFFDFDAYMARQRRCALDWDAARSVYEARLRAMIESDQAAAWRYFAADARNRLTISEAERRGHLDPEDRMVSLSGPVAKLLDEYASSIKSVYLEQDPDVYIVMPFGYPSDALALETGEIDMYGARMVTGQFAKSGAWLGDEIVRFALDGRRMDLDGSLAVLGGQPVAGFRPDGTAELARAVSVWHLAGAPFRPVVRMDLDIGRNGSLRFGGLLPFAGEWVLEGKAGEILEPECWDICKELSGLYFDFRNVHVVWDGLDVDMAVLRDQAVASGSYVECPDLDYVPEADGTDG